MFIVVARVRGGLQMFAKRRLPDPAPRTSMRDLKDAGD
jgi:hypothetical protein